jgi:DegV family protein with EDD domain
MTIAIVTDSTSDIPVDIAEHYHISVMPNLVIIDGKSYEDNIGISREEFYRRLPGMKTLPTTATASSGSYIELYEKLFSQGFAHIISIHAPALLSGIFNAASLAAQSFGDQVRVIDSGQVTMALGFQALAAAEDAQQGHNLERVLAHLADLRNRAHLMAMLDTLEYIRRSGRVSWARASIGNLLQLKLFVNVIDGKVLRIGEVRSRAKGVQRLVEMIKSLAPLERLAILHTNAEEDAHHLLENLDIPLPERPFILNVTTVIGTHAGPGALGFAAVTRQGL